MKKSYKLKKCKKCGRTFKPLTGSVLYCGSSSLKFGCIYKNRLNIANKAFKKHYLINKLKINTKRRELYDANPVKAKIERLWTRFRITLEQYQDLLKKQNCKCAICGFKLNIEKNSSAKDAPHIDHCHKTGKVRGILCQSCNFGIGFLKDSVGNLEKAIEYLTLST